MKVMKVDVSPGVFKQGLPVKVLVSKYDEAKPGPSGIVKIHVDGCQVYAVETVEGSIRFFLPGEAAGRGKS